MFEFSAGSPALCLVDTIGDRRGAGTERLHEPQDLSRWLREAALIGVDGREASLTDLMDVRALRDAIYRSAVALMAAGAPAPEDIALINSIARAAPPRPQWHEGRIASVAEDDIRAALSVLAADAVAVLASPLVDRVRLCPECRMMFVDRSAAGRRRWCSSASGCGNRIKVRQHRARRLLQQKGQTGR